MTPDIKQTRRPRYQRKIQILGIMLSFGKYGLSMRGIAWWMGLSPSNHLMKILHEMEKESLLESKTIQWRPNSRLFWWTISSVGAIAYDWNETAKKELSS